MPFSTEISVTGVAITTFFASASSIRSGRLSSAALKK